MVNAELFRKIADQIELAPESYFQPLISYKRECGTAYCIGGWAFKLTYGTTYPYLGEDCHKADGDEDILSAQELLGLDNRSAKELFDGSWEPADDLTVPQALRLIADGKSVSEVSA